jgi:hypothetical protein
MTARPRSSTNALQISRQSNKKMQRTSHGQNGGSPLIFVFSGRFTVLQERREG